MQKQSRTGTVWARQVAHALSKHLDGVDCDFNWALAHEDNLSKTPTRAWPSNPWLMFQVDAGPASGIHVRVLNRAGCIAPEPLVTLKFKSPLCEATTCVGLVSSFLESLDPRKLPSC